MESQPQNPEIRIKPEYFHPCLHSTNHNSSRYRGFNMSAHALLK